MSSDSHPKIDIVVVAAGETLTVPALNVEWWFDRTTDIRFRCVNLSRQELLTSVLWRHFRITEKVSVLQGFAWRNTERPVSNIYERVAVTGASELVISDDQRVCQSMMIFMY